MMAWRIFRFGGQQAKENVTKKAYSVDRGGSAVPVKRSVPASACECMCMGDIALKALGLVPCRRWPRLLMTTAHPQNAPQSAYTYPPPYTHRGAPKSSQTTKPKRDTD